MFEQKLKELNIKHKLIKLYTLRHNEKVERNHKKIKKDFIIIKYFLALKI